jgi:hypothetical protein
MFDYILNVKYRFHCIQDVPGGHSISHSKEKGVYVHVSYSKRFQDTAISLYSSKIVERKEILRTVSNTSIYCSSDKVGAVYLV